MSTVPVPRAAPARAPVAERAAADRDTLIERARALIPLLAERAQATEQAGQVLPDVIERLRDAGLFRIVQPRRVGGYELPATIFFDIGSLLGRGCASTSWVLGNIASHHLMLAHWPERAQQEVWGDDGAALVGASYVFPAGRAHLVDGGYRLRGQWPFSSGIDPCEWVTVGAMVERDGAAPERRYFLLPRADYTILDTWRVSGLQGTGSKDVACTDVFVPEHRTVSHADVTGATSPGLAANPQALFRYPFWAAGGYVLLSTMYGAAIGALEGFVERTRGSASRSSGQGIAAHPTMQQRIGRAAALLDTVELTARTRLGDLHRMLEERGALDVAYAARVRRDSAYCATLCVEAIDLLFTGAGGSALYTDNPLQRAWRDIHAGAGNFTLQWDVVGPAYGRVLLGLPSGLPGLPV